MLNKIAEIKKSMPARLRSIVSESGKFEGYCASVPAPIDDFPSLPRLLARGITRRCPWCGDRRAYFVGWFKRQERCRNCAHAYRRGDAAFELGATTANIMLTFFGILSTILVLVVLTLPDIPVFGVMFASVGVALVGPALFYPISFTLWQAIDLSMRPPTEAELAGERDAVL
jgi:uncharacterized protein (DUF983 family)